MNYDAPVYLRDLLPRSIEPARLSAEEIQKFVEGVNWEMNRLGFTEANEITARSERLTEEDYMAYVNV